MTARSILYRLLPLGYTKDEEGDLLYVLNRGRRAGLIPRAQIADGRTERYDPRVWDDADEFRTTMAASARSFTLDRLYGQVYIESYGSRPRAWSRCSRTSPTRCRS